MTDASSPSLTLQQLRDRMRVCVLMPDNRDAGAIWTWRVVEWIDELDAVLSPLIEQEKADQR